MNLLIKTIILIAMISFLGCAAIEEKAPGPGGKVAICHKGKTIYVDEAAVEAHLAHGDYLGLCK